MILQSDTHIPMVSRLSFTFFSGLAAAIATQWCAAADLAKTPPVQLETIEVKGSSDIGNDAKDSVVAKHFVSRSDIARYGDSRLGPPRSGFVQQRL